MTLKTKLNLVSVILSLVAVVIGVIGINGIRQTNAGLQTVYNDRVVPLEQLKAIADDYAVAIIDAVNKANAGITTAEETLKGVVTASENIQKNWNAYMATQLTPEESKLAGEAKALFVPADEAVNRLRKHLSGKTGKLQGTLGDFDGPLYDQIDPISSKITELVSLQLRVAKEEYTAAHQRYQAALMLSVLVLAIGVASGAGFGWATVRKVTRTLNKIADAVHEGSDQTASASSQVATASQSLAEGASEQAASLEETSASLEEMSSMTSRNAENVQTAKAAANQARAVADGGVENVKHMSEAIAGIQESTNEMRSAIGAIQISGQEVSKIVKTIDEIAFQTNILALNAAVEAARAGEAGLGFAVVADEVRNLAQRSAKAARETADKIEDSLRKGEEGVRVSQKVAESSVAVTAKATAVGASLEEIVTQIRQLDGMMAQVADASREQNAGVEQINMAVSQIDKTTQSTAATAEESAAASQELSAQAVSLRQTVGELKSLMTGRPVAEELAKSPGAKDPAAGASSHRTPTLGRAVARPVAARDAASAVPPAGVEPGIPMPPRGATINIAGKAPAEHDFRDF
jgi:methyl-accepting chemotaxis protein